MKWGESAVCNMLARSLGWRAQFESGIPCASRGQNQAPHGALENRSQPAGRGRQEVHCRQCGCGKQGEWFSRPHSATYCCGPEARHLPSLSLSAPIWEMGIYTSSDYFTCEIYKSYTLCWCSKLMIMSRILAMTLSPISLVGSSISGSLSGLVIATGRNCGTIIITRTLQSSRIYSLGHDLSHYHLL